MESYGGKLSPSNHWNFNLNIPNKELTAYSKDLYDEKYDTLEKMLDPWVGSIGMQPIGIEAVQKYENFLRPIDIADLLPEDIYSHLSESNWRETDLGTILDFNLISIFGGFKTGLTSRINISEVGGGYGRLAEAILEKFPGRVHYVMIDAVPGSLMYSYLYLKSQFPELSIGSYYAGDEYNSNYDCYIVPSWRTDILDVKTFDLLINIESMQEMRQDQVDFYINLFNKLGSDDSIVYLSNARDYVFLGDWLIPDNWKTLYLNNTPRSWSANHPTHILLKDSNRSCWSHQRNAHEQAFRDQINNWNNSVLISELRSHISDRDRICGELKFQLDELRSNAVSTGVAPRPLRLASEKALLLIRRVLRKFLTLVR